MDNRRVATDSARIVGKIKESVGKVIVGKDDIIEMLITCLLAGGHVLIEDVPGVGKTTLVRALARSLGCEFSRIQFTPDLLPSDVTGISVLNQKTGEFEFKPGPIMNRIVLADEINRTSPKTQASLLECMAEKQVTVDGKTYELPSPFMVLATQNPIEYEGTFPLPEAQVDRFMLNIKIGYPTLVEEVEMLDRLSTNEPLALLEPVTTPDEVNKLQEYAASVYIDPDLKDYMVRIVQHTRRHPSVYLGASPRGSIALMRLTRARALVQGREYVTPEDIKVLAVPTLAHRLLVKPEVVTSGQNAAAIIEATLSRIPVPTEG